MAQPTWVQIEQAVQQVLATATGIPVIWSNQNADAPALDYVRISFGAAIPVFTDWPVESLRSGSPPAGQEVAQAVMGTRELPLVVECFTAATVEETGKATALSVVDTAVARLRLPEARTALAAVGLTPFAPGATTWIPDVVATGFRGRALCEVRCYLPARAVEEYTTYIASIAGAVTVKGGPAGDLVVPLSAS